jgi:hypothetical protein
VPPDGHRLFDPRPRTHPGPVPQTNAAALGRLACDASSAADACSSRIASTNRSWRWRLSSCIALVRRQHRPTHPPSPNHSRAFADGGNEKQSCASPLQRSGRPRVMHEAAELDATGGARAGVSSPTDRFGKQLSVGSTETHSSPNPGRSARLCRATAAPMQSSSRKFRSTRPMGGARGGDWRRAHASPRGRPPRHERRRTGSPVRSPLDGRVAACALRVSGVAASPRWARHNEREGPSARGSSQLAIYEPYTVHRLRLASVVALSNA